MPLNHSKAAVTISVGGLALSWINRRKGGRFEVGVLRCDRHAPSLDIEKIELADDGEPVSSSIVPHSLSLDQDILVRVEYPDRGTRSHSARPVKTFTRRGFDRWQDKGDQEDFRWIPDLEGKEFHNRKLRLTDPSLLKPTIFITEGTVYARQKTDEVFGRFSIEGKPATRPLGKLGDGINADIDCAPGGVVVLSNLSGDDVTEPGSRQVELPSGHRIRYRIVIENHCKLAADKEGTDFRLFYDVLKDPTGKQFDLRRLVQTGSHGAAEEPLPDLSDFSQDGFPQTCTGGFLGSSGGPGG